MSRRRAPFTPFAEDVVQRPWPGNVRSDVVADDAVKAALISVLSNQQVTVFARRDRERDQQLCWRFLQRVQLLARGGRRINSGKAFHQHRRSRWAGLHSQRAQHVGDDVERRSYSGRRSASRARTWRPAGSSRRRRSAGTAHRAAAVAQRAPRSLPCACRSGSATTLRQQGHHRTDHRIAADSCSPPHRPPRVASPAR